jgi:hypothetical protein
LLLDYSDASNYEGYARALGGIIQGIVYFSTTAQTLNSNLDSDSPYYQTSDGKLMLKTEVDSFIQQNKPY